MCAVLLTRHSFYVVLILQPLLANAQFFNTMVSQGSVAKCLRCGGIVIQSLLSLLVKECLKSVNIWQSYSQDYSVLLLFY